MGWGTDTTNYQRQQQKNQRILAEQAYRQAKQTKREAPNRLKKAEKKYYKAIDKVPDFNKLLNNRYTNEANEILKGWDNTFNDYKEDVNALLVYYKSQSEMTPHLQDMSKIYKQRNKKLYGELKNATNESNVALRLTNYYNNNNEYQSIINDYLKKFYWFVFSILIILFFFKGGWRNIKSYAFIMTLVFLPIFLLNPLITFIFSKMQHIAIDYFYLGIAALIIIVFCSLSYFNNLALSTFNKSLPE